FFFSSRRRHTRCLSDLSSDVCSSDLILQSARWGGLPAPSSCEAGHCATCMARVVEGQVEMAKNDALTPEEVSDGWVLTCQAVPRSEERRVGKECRAGVAAAE